MGVKKGFVKLDLCSVMPDREDDLSKVYFLQISFCCTLYAEMDTNIS